MRRRVVGRGDLQVASIQRNGVDPDQDLSRRRDLGDLEVADELEAVKAVAVPAASHQLNAAHCYADTHLSWYCCIFRVVAGRSLGELWEDGDCAHFARRSGRAKPTIGEIPYER